VQRRARECCGRRSGSFQQFRHPWHRSSMAGLHPPDKA
jgi:hypothetical protein